MHDHETCEQLMAYARRAGRMGRLEYLATRCDLMHGEIDDTTTDQPEGGDAA